MRNALKLIAIGQRLLCPRPCETYLHIVRDRNQARPLDNLHCSHLTADFAEEARVLRLP